VGAVYPAICGQVLCGQTLCATWRTTWDEPQLILQPRTFSITITEGPLIRLTVNRPVLFLNARPFDKQTDSSLAFGRPTLRLLGKPFVLQPFLGVLLNKPVLYLRGKAILLGVSSELQFGRPLLILLGGRISRVGRAGLIPTVPESRPLQPTPDYSSTLAPATAVSRTLVATATGTSTLQPTDVSEDEDLLVPTTVEVR
jgi:hypothetical protein